MRQPARRRVIYFGALLVWLLCVCASSGFAQSLGDIARAERERKKEQPQPELHVYTNDDLEKPHILVPEDQARVVAARTRNSLTPPPAVVASESSVPAPASTPTVAQTGLPVSSPVPSPAAKPAVPVVVVSSPHQIESPAKNVQEIRPESQPQAQPTPQIVTHRAARTVLVSSPSGWKVVNPQPHAGHVERTNYTQPPVPNFVPAPRPSQVPQPQPMPRNEAAPRKVVPREVEVSRGDSLWKIAARYLGSGTKWWDLAELNPQLANPSRIYVGERIRLLPNEPQRQTAKQVVVRHGDTLWSMAQSEFGSGMAFHCIANANPGLPSVDLIRPGDTLVLPDTCALAR